MAIILLILAVFDAILAGNPHYMACGNKYGHKRAGTKGHSFFIIGKLSNFAPHKG